MSKITDKIDPLLKMALAEVNSIKGDPREVGVACGHYGGLDSAKDALEQLDINLDLMRQCVQSLLNDCDQVL